MPSMNNTINGRRYEPYTKWGKSALHAKHEQQHQPQKRLESSILRKIVALDVLNEAHPLSSLLLTSHCKFPASINVACRCHSKLSPITSPSTGQILLLSCEQPLAELIFQSPSWGTFLFRFKFMQKLISMGLLVCRSLHCLEWRGQRQTKAWRDVAGSQYVMTHPFSKGLYNLWQQEKPRTKSSAAATTVWITW
jgi:hypothetical protein